MSVFPLIEEIRQKQPDWRAVKFKTTSEVQLGKMLQPKQERPEDTKEPYLRAANISWSGVNLSDVQEMWVSPFEKSKYDLRAGDVLVSEGGDVGRSSFLTEDLPGIYFQNAINRVRPGKESDGRFLYYWLNVVKSSGWLEILCNRATIAHFTADKLRETEIILPPLPTQRRIAAYLDRETAQIDALVAEKETLLGLLEEKRASLISHAVTRGLNPKAKLKPSGIPWLGDVPVHWDLVPLSSVISYLSYGFTNPMPSFHEGEGVPLLTTNDIGEGVVKFETARKTTREAFSGLTGKCRPMKDDILITKDGTLGRIAVSDGTECCINQSVALLRINPAKANIQFVAIALAARAYQDRMIFEAGGTTIKHIYITRLAKMTFALPPKTEQDALVTYGMNSLAAIDSLLGSVNESITLLRESAAPSSPPP